MQIFRHMVRHNLANFNACLLRRTVTNLSMDEGNADTFKIARNQNHTEGTATRNYNSTNFRRSTDDHLEAENLKLNKICVDKAKKDIEKIAPFWNCTKFPDTQVIEHKITNSMMWEWVWHRDFTRNWNDSGRKSLFSTTLMRWKVKYSVAGFITRFYLKKHFL